MACNCNEEGKVINIGLGCCVPVVANADAYYTKSEIDEKLDDIIISGGGITSGEVQTMIDSSIEDKADKSEIPTVPKNVSAFVNDVPYLTEHQSLTDYATKQWVEDKHYITGVDLSDYALKSEIPDISGLASETYVSNYTYDKATIDEKVAQGGTFDPTQYYNKTQTNQLLSEKADTATTYSKVEVDNLLGNKANKSDLNNYYNKSQTDVLLAEKLDATAYTPTDLSNYYTKQETDSQINSSTANMATKTWVQNQNYITGVDLSNYALKEEIPDISGYATETWVQNQGYLTEHQDLSSYALKSEIPDISGYATEQWVQSQGYLTQHQDLSDYALKSEIPDISGKQDISGMTAYTQTTAFTAHTASTTVHVTQTEKNTWNSKVDSSTLNNYMLKSQIWCGTASEYEAITTKDPNIIYLIHS